MSRTSFLLAGLLSLVPVASWANQAPLLGVPSTATVPGGKSLVIPLIANDPDGGPLTFKVISSNASIIARVKTGQPYLKLNVSHASSGSSDPAFQGSLALALFRDWTPRGAETIAGLAQAGFYDGLRFHRLFATLAQAGGAAGNDNFAATALFADEYQPQLIYAGTGQLAMANRGVDTNTSQFFITNSPLRSLDFNFTNFGQLVRGFDVLDSIANIANPATNGGTVQSDNSTSPTSPVIIDSATVEPSSGPGNSDAVLVLSSTGTDAPATITVTVTDAENLSTTQTLTATPVPDDTDDPPFLTAAVRDQTVPKNTVIAVPLPVIDLESDFLQFVGDNASNIAFPDGLQSAVTKKSLLLLPPPTFRGALNLQVGLRQQGAFERGNRALGGSFFDITDTDIVNISVGDGSYSVKPLPLEFAKGIALTNVQVAKLLVTPPAGQMPAFLAQIDWGDNTVQTGTLSKVAGGYVIRGSHTYARAGTFPVKVRVQDQFTVSQTTNGTTTNSTVGGAWRETTTYAYVADPATFPIVVKAKSLALSKKGKFSGVVATFTDAAAASGNSYFTTIDWGNGVVSAGTIKSLPEGGFTISGSNLYPDADDYSLSIRVTRINGGPSAAAFGRMVVGGNRTSYPPFRNIDLQGQWLSLSYKNSGTGASVVGTITGQYSVKNTGKLPSAPATLTVYYSSNLFAADGTDDVNLGQVVIPALKPGKSKILSFSPKNGASHAPLTLPTGVDFTVQQYASIVTRLTAPHVAPSVIDVKHYRVDRPLKKN